MHEKKAVQKMQTGMANIRIGSYSSERLHMSELHDKKQSAAFESKNCSATAKVINRLSPFIDVTLLVMAVGGLEGGTYTGIQSIIIGSFGLFWMAYRLHKYYEEKRIKSEKFRH
jgi:hypothetical protein